jgi:alpha-beta hydrolase superfamily lysophospholipase
MVDRRRPGPRRRARTVEERRSHTRRPAATFVLVPGADGRAWYWHRLVPELRRLGHETVAADLPVAEETAGLAECAEHAAPERS